MQSKREVYLDLAKFFAMIMMVAGHSFFEFADPRYYNLNEFPWNWWNFARGKTAPVFLFLSGAVHVFANFKANNSVIDGTTFLRRVKMAFSLLVIAYVLNSPINFLSEIYQIQESKLDKFFQVNILHIFGVGLLLLALIYRFAGSRESVLKICLMLGITITGLTPIISNADLSCLPPALSNYLNYQGGSIFAVFPYLSYMFFGTVFGIWLKNSLASSKIFRIRLGAKILLAGTFLIIIGIIITKLTIYSGFEVKLRTDIGVVIRNTGIILFLIAAARQIKFSDLTLVGVISTLSKRAIYIYVIHLFIIYGIGPLAGFKHYFGKMFTPLEGLIASLLVIILSILLTLLTDYLLKFRVTKYIFLSILGIYSIYFLIN
ncbi:MAG: heparan-alpha-glucosaminide N-acetyltransferase domain-containing protein [Candidatus Kapaibacterium sp.]|jgi:uncharacterized membrane protein